MPFYRFQLGSSNDALSYLSRILYKKGYMITKPVDIIGRHKHRDIHCEHKETKAKKRIYMIFKNVHFLEHGWESINIECLYWCIDHKTDEIIIVYADGKIYSLSPKKWKQYADEHGTYRIVEKQDTIKQFGKILMVEERTASVDLKELRRFDTNE